MFAGIGGFRAGLTRAGGFQCVGHCEIDKYADASYRAIHDIREEKKYYPDARKIDPSDLPPFDLLCGGFPCQSWSAAGHRLGFADPRGALFFEITRLAEARRPAYLLLENVPRILQHDQGQAFATILTTLHELGYGLEWAVHNSADFGPPHSRKRVFIVGYLDSRCAGKILPVFGTNGKALIQVLGGPQGARVYDPAGTACTQTAVAGGKTGLYLIPPHNATFVDLCAGEPRRTDMARCLTARYGQTTLSNHRAERSGVLLVKEGTKTSADVQSIVERGGRIRRLVPRECLRLQGFAEDQIDRLLAITSDAQAYKQAGNSVTVNVIEAIGRRIRAVDEALREEDASA